MRAGKSYTSDYIVDCRVSVQSAVCKAAFPKWPRIAYVLGLCGTWYPTLTHYVSKHGIFAKNRRSLPVHETLHLLSNNINIPKTKNTPNTPRWNIFNETDTTRSFIHKPTIEKGTFLTSLTELKTPSTPAGIKPPKSPHAMTIAFPTQHYRLNGLQMW